MTNNKDVVTEMKDICVQLYYLIQILFLEYQLINTI